MRVVGGSAGGRRLQAPPGKAVRPTSDRVREAVFNVLGSLGGVEGATVLDLFAGSGAMGIEALSQGAARATFVESDARAVAVIERNLASTGLADAARVVRGDALRFLAGPSPADAVDVAFADPPYAFAQWNELLNHLVTGLAVLESDRTIALPEEWQPVRERRYGGTVVTLARRKGVT